MAVAPVKLPGRALGRRTLGIFFIFSTVFLWTASNFLASTIFADDSYPKPFFVTYFNTTSFTLFLVFKLFGTSIKLFFRRFLSRNSYQSLHGVTPHDESQSFLHPSDSEIPIDSAPGPDNAPTLSLADPTPAPAQPQTPVPRLTTRETFRLSLSFCALWFLANFTQSKGLEYTTVSSATIFMSTSGLWTLAFGTLFRVEAFTFRKMLGVLASLGGVVMVSSVDWSGGTDAGRGAFPHKSTSEIAVGDVLALLSAVFYGVYTVLVKRRIGDESRVDMLLFLGFVGLINAVLLWPGFLILHFTGVERFELPPTGRIWGIVLLNAGISIVADMCWAWAVLFSTPLVVTVGLSLSIPLSLIGQMLINKQTSSALYWVGAVIVFVAFIFVNLEKQDPPPESKKDVEDSPRELEDRRSLLHGHHGA